MAFDAIFAISKVILKTVQCFVISCLFAFEYTVVLKQIAIVEQLDAGLKCVVTLQLLLTPEVRYELRDEDKLTFADVHCSFLVLPTQQVI